MKVYDLDNLCGATSGDSDSAFRDTLVNWAPSDLDDAWAGPPQCRDVPPRLDGVHLAGARAL